MEGLGTIRARAMPRFGDQLMQVFHLARGYLADATAQIEAAGYRKVGDPTTGRWHWSR
jgi:hypothetical protein